MEESILQIEFPKSMTKLHLMLSADPKINNDKLIPNDEKILSEGVEVDAEMIIGMPYDNEDRWLDTIQKNMDLNINHQKSFSHGLFQTHHGK